MGWPWNLVLADLPGQHSENTYQVLSLLEASSLCSRTSSDDSEHADEATTGLYTNLALQ